MKLPCKNKLLKLPRKLKKELKKGFTRNIHPSFPAIKESQNPLTGSVSCSMYQNISYSGSNTKSFFRLCKFARKEERMKIKNMHESMGRDILNRSLKFLNTDSDSESLLNGTQIVSYDKYIVGFDPAIGFSHSITGSIDPIHASLIALHPKINI
jgi:hypothetical protein